MDRQGAGDLLSGSSPTRLGRWRLIRKGQDGGGAVAIRPTGCAGEEMGQC